MTTFTADLSSVGEWDGQEQDAVDCWNRYVAPALERCYDRYEDETGAEGDEYGYVASRAWEMFCDTTDEESFNDLGRRVANWINAQS